MPVGRAPAAPVDGGVDVVVGVAGGGVATGGGVGAAGGGGVGSTGAAVGSDELVGSVILGQCLPSSGRPIRRACEWRHPTPLRPPAEAHPVVLPSTGG